MRCSPFFKDRDHLRFQVRVQDVHQVLPTWQDSNVILSPQHQAAAEMSLLTFQLSSCCLLPSSLGVSSWSLWLTKGSTEVSACILVLPTPHSLSVLGLYLLIAAALIAPNFDHCPLSSSVIFCSSSEPGHPSVLALDYQFQLSQQPQTLTFDSSTHLFTILCSSSAKSETYPPWGEGVNESCLWQNRICGHSLISL